MLGVVCLIMEDLEAIFEELDLQEFLLMVMKLHSREYDEIETKRAAGSKPNVDNMVRIKKIFDHIAEKMVIVYK